MASLPPLIPIPDRAGRELPQNNSSPTRPSRSRSYRPFLRVLLRKNGGSGRGMPPLIGRNATANTKGGGDTNDSVGALCSALGQCYDCNRDNDTIFDKNGPSIESYAVYHDEIVTALIDEAIRKGEDETIVTDGQQAIEANSETRSSHRTKRNATKQLGIGSAGVPKLLKRARSDLTVGGGDKKYLLSDKPPPIRRSVTMNSKMSSNDPSGFFHQDCILRKEMGSDKQKSKLGFGLTNAKSNNSDGAPYATGREETLLKLQTKLSMLGDIESGKFGMAAEMLRSDAVAFAIQAHKVETRSILTLRMGFVSMSYGILLQWDCRTGLVELIVLRKMCRNDFLKGKGNSDQSARESNLISESQRDLQLTKTPLLPPTPALIPVPLADVSPTEVSLDSTSPPNFLQNQNACGRRIVSKVSLPPNPLAGIPSFLTGITSSKSQYFLSVSVLRVTGLFVDCDSCKNSNSAERKVNGAPLRKHHTVRPFIRFSLGKHEHCTSVTRFNSGNAKWSRRNHNSCLLPCPPEGLRWFAGQEDLIVEVLNDWENPNSSGYVDISSKNQQHSAMLGVKSDERTSSNKGRRIIAAVKVPLASVNIEDEDDISAEGGTWKRHACKDGSSSTEITIPLRMNCCPNAPMGSISLKMTMKVPSHRGGIDTSSNPALSRTNNIQVVNESIELGPLMRYMDGWSLGGGARETRDAAKTKSWKKRQRLRWSKRFDLQTKRWSTLTLNSSSLKEEGGQGDGTFGWFTFLNIK